MKPIGSDLQTPRPCVLVAYAKNSETLDVEAIYTSGTGLYWSISATKLEEAPVPEAPEPAFTVPLGPHRHFKGDTMAVVCRVRNAETLENWIVYEHAKERWVRPERMFLEEVVWPDGIRRARFVPGEG